VLQATKTLEAACSARMLQPFMRWVSSNSPHRDLVPDEFWATPSDARVSLQRVYDMLDGGVERARDELLGLRLGRAMTFGGGGAFDYAVRSAPTFGDSLTVASRYSRLLADPFRITFERWQKVAIVRLEYEGSWRRAAADFAVAAVHKLHIGEYASEGQVEAWFPYSAPRSTTEYSRIMPGVTPRFGAPFFGLVFPRALADLALPGADAALHALLSSRADAMLAELGASRPLAAVVRRLIADELPQATPTAERIARAVHMSRRTLARRLEQERTTFDAELDAVRRRIALDAVVDAKVPLSAVAFLAGFSHVESFYRAFRRWTNTTPLAYRTAHLSPMGRETSPLAAP
jgi:AraC-like DNA-binding protein